MHEEPVPLRKMNRAVPRDLETIVQKAMARDPQQRYARAADLAADLQRFLEDRPIQARPVGAVERSGRWCRRNPAIATLTGIAAVLLIAGTTVSLAFALHARMLAGQAQQAADKADASADAKRRLIGRQYIENGVRFEEQGDVTGALLWYAAALAQNQDDPEQAEADRIRIATTRRGCPGPAHVWFHEGRVRAACLSPDGRLAATGGDGCQVHLWDTASGKPAGVPLTHPHPIVAIAFSADGTRLLVQSTANPHDPFGRGAARELRVWDTATGTPLTPVLPHHLYEPASGSTNNLQPRWTADGKRLLYRADPAEVRVVDVDTGKDVGPPLRIATDKVLVMLWHADGRRVVTVSQGPRPGKTGLVKEVRVWDPTDASAVTLATLPANTAVNLCNDLRHADVGPIGAPAIWDLAAYRVLRRNLRVGLIGPNGRCALSGQFAYDVGSWQRLAQLNDAGLQVFSPDDQWLAVAGSGNTARVWNVRTGAAICPPLRHDAPVRYLEFSADGRYLLTVSNDQAARVWEVQGSDGFRATEAQSGQPVSPQLRHAEQITSASFSRDGYAVLTTSGTTAQLWPVRTRRLAPVRIRTAGQIRGAALTSDGQRLIVSCQVDPALPEPGQSVSVWDAGSGRSIALAGITAPTRVDLAHSSPTGRFVLRGRTTAGNTPQKQTDYAVWETDTGAALPGFTIPETHGRQPVAWSPDDETLLVCWRTPTGTVQGVLRAVRTGKAVSAVLEFGECQQLHAAFSRDGRRLLTYNMGEQGLGPGVRWLLPELRVRDAANGALLAHIKPAPHGAAPPNLKPDARLLVAVLSPDGRHVLTGMQDGSYRLWDAATGAPVHDPWRLAAISHDNNGTGAVPGDRACFSADGRRVAATGGNDSEGGQVRIWDVATGRPCAPVLHHERSVLHVEFSADGKQLVSTCADGTVRLWDGATGEPLAPALKHTGVVWLAHFSADGTRLYSLANRHGFNVAIASAPTDVRLWDARTALPLTAPLDTQQAFHPGTPLGPARLDRACRHIVLAADDHELHIHPLLPDQQPLDAITATAEALSGRRLSATGTILPLEPERFRLRWSKLPATGATEHLRPVPLVAAWHVQRARELIGGVAFWATGAHRIDPAMALWHLDRARIARDGMHEQDWWLVRAHALAALGRNVEAIDAYDKARAAWRMPNLATACMSAGICQALLGNWVAAKAEFDKLPQAHNYRALVCLHEGDLAGYRKACADQFKGRGMYGLGTATLPLARISVLADGALPANAYAKLLEEAERHQHDFFDPLAQSRGPMPINLAAAIHLRAGRPEAAVKLLTASMANDTPVPAQDRFYLAMAQQKLGQAAAAKAALAGGVARLERLKRERLHEDPGAAHRFWQERVEEQLLCRAAQAIVLAR
jgi:WD40 repeat protein